MSLPPPPPELAELPAPVPLDKPEALPWWTARHAALRAQAQAMRAAGQAPQLVFLGDSITHGWDDVGQPVWQARYAARPALAMGCWGDRTEHLLWRLQHGALDNLAPRLLVLLIGTNDSGDLQAPPARTAAGVWRLLDELQRRLPASRVLLLALLPREHAPEAPLRQLNEAVNTRLRALADGQRVHFLDVGAALTDAAGWLDPALLPDQLHLSEAGYRRLADAIDPTLDRLLAAAPLDASCP